MKAKTKTTATKEEATPALVPKLRFPEFRETEAWHFNSLDSVCEVLNNRRRPITGNERTPGPYPYYGASGIVDYVGDFIFDERLLLVGEDGAKWGAFEKTAFIADGKYWVNNHAHVLKPIAANDTLLENYLTMLDLSPFVTGAAPPKLTLGKLKGIPIPLPPKPAEQQKIAECLSSVDELIAAQARKLDALKTHKKGLMQQLFPREGETQPRLRFPEFQNTEEWEQRKLGELFSNRVEKGVDGLPIYSVTMNDGMVKRASLDREFDDISDPAGNKKVHKKDIAYNMMRMWQGALGVAIEGCLVSPAYVVLSPCEHVCPEFFALLFKLPQSLRFLTAHSRGLTKDRLRLYYKDFALIPIRCPDFAEQQRIADCLTSLDDLIAAQTQKLEALKTHKKGLMQQLFPSPEEVSA